MRAAPGVTARPSYQHPVVSRPRRTHRIQPATTPPPAPRTARTATAPPRPPGSIAGGFVKLGTAELALAWTAYTLGHIRPYDFRVWLAAHEVLKRRAWMKRGQEASWSAEEVRALVGGGGAGSAGERAVRRSLRRLGRLGLMSWKKEGPRFASELRALALEGEEREEFEAALESMLEGFPRRRRFVPLPRRMLRVLAGGVKRSVLATVLGHCARCLFRGDSSSGWRGDGACSAAWVAEAFSVGESTVRAARAHLRDELGWLRPLHDRPQRVVNRHGGRFAVALDWTRPEEAPGSSTPAAPRAAVETPAPAKPQGAHAAAPARTALRPAAELSTAESRGPRAENERESRGLERNRPLLPKRTQTSDPAPEGPGPSPSESSTKKVGEGKSSAPPKLNDVTREDLRSTARVMELFDQALVDPHWQRRGEAPRDSYPERINWAAAAARVRARGGTNPAGLFLHIVRNRRWGDISNADEEAVRLRVAEWRDGEAQGSYGPTVKRRRTVCAEDLELEEEEYLRERVVREFQGW